MRALRLPESSKVPSAAHPGLSQSATLTIWSLGRSAWTLFKWCQSCCQKAPRGMGPPASVPGIAAPRETASNQTYALYHQARRPFLLNSWKRYSSILRTRGAPNLAYCPPSFPICGSHMGVTRHHHILRVPARKPLEISPFKYLVPFDPIHDFHDELVYLVGHPDDRTIHGQIGLHTLFLWYWQLAAVSQIPIEGGLWKLAPGLQRRVLGCL